MKIFLKKIKYKIQCLIIYLSDFNFYINNTSKNDVPTIVYKLRKDYHKIEKGLTLKPRRDYFGKKVIENIMQGTDTLIELAPNNKDINNSLNVLKHYLDAHNGSTKLDYIKSYLEKKISVSTISSPLIINPKISESDLNGYETVLKTRKSVRYYQDKKIDTEDIIKSVELALLTPSVCNRQSWHVHFIQDKNIINQLISFQNGNTGFGKDIKNLIIITGDINSFLSPKERNQLWFDSGLFSMNLINSLHANNIASCFLNWCQDKKVSSKVQSILNIPKFEVPTVFVSLGYYEENTEVCHSPRKNIKECLKFHN